MRKTLAAVAVAAALFPLQTGHAATPAASTAVSAASMAVAPYVDMGAWPTPVLSTLATKGNVKNFTLGFVTSSGCKASWFAAYDPRSGWQRDEIDKLRAAGGDVKISFGGAGGIELAYYCMTPAALADEYDVVVKTYALKYVDFDIEGAAAADPATIGRRSQAMKILQDRNPGLKISLTLPVLPTGLTADGLNVVQQAKNAGVSLDMVNVMAMDYYQGPADQGAKAIAAAKSTHAQVKSVLGISDDAAAWKKIGVTPMLGVNDSRTEIFLQKDARALVSFASSVHLGMLSTWEQGRDANACNGALYRCTNVSQQPYEFSKIFAGYTG